MSWVFLILVAAAAIYFGAHEVALAQVTTPNVAPPFQGLPTTPNVTPPFQGLWTPVTSTVTNCMIVVQLAGGKLPDRLLYSDGADDRVRSWRRDLKRDIEYSLRNGLHFEADSRVRRAALYYPPKLEDKTRRRPFPVAYSVIPVTVPPPPLPAALVRRGD